MTWTGVIVLYSIFFFFALFIILPRGVRTQAEAGEVEPGTPPGAPAAIRIWRKFLWAALVAGAVVALISLVVESEILSLDDLDFLYPEALRDPPPVR